MICAVGNTTAEVWPALLAGKSGVARITGFDASAFACQIAAEVKSFDPLKFIEKKEIKKMGRFIHLALAASDEAMKMSQLQITPENAERVGVHIGSGIGGFDDGAEGSGFAAGAGSAAWEDDATAVSNAVSASASRFRCPVRFFNGACRPSSCHLLLTRIMSARLTSCAPAPNLRLASTGSDGACVSIHDPIANLFHIPRRDIASAHHRDLRDIAMQTWRQIAHLQAA